MDESQLHLSARGILCMVHGLLVFMMAYGARFSELAAHRLPDEQSSFALVAFWLWLPWVVTCMPAAAVGELGRKAGLVVGLLAWLASAWVMIWTTMATFMYT
jgi:hypothetical protein